MDYEKAYKEAKLRMSAAYNSNRCTIGFMNEIFPELKESENEVIRKEIISALKWANDKDGVYDKHISWLEKQGSQKNKINSYKFTFEDVLALECSMKTAKITKDGDELYKILVPLYNKIHNAYLAERQCEQVDCPQDLQVPNGGIVLEDFNGGEGHYKVNLDFLNKKQVEKIEKIINDWNKDTRNVKQCIRMILTDASEQRFKVYGVSLKECLDWLEKQGEQKHTEEIKPKFKIGDWICNAISLRNISSIENGMYYFDESDKMPIEFVDKYYHLWIINDSEEGDVLVDEYGNIGIFKKCVGICWCSNMYLGCDNELYDVIGGTHIITGTKPATKRQRELLFKKMEYRGYKWDAEKKKITEKI